MKPMIAVLAGLLFLAGCRSTPPEPSPGDPGTPPAKPTAGEPTRPPAPASEKPVPPVPPPENLLATPERGKLYYDLDQYALKYMQARDRGDTTTWTSLHETVLKPLVDKHLDEILKTAAAKDDPVFRRMAVRGLGFGSDAERIVPALLPVLAESDVAARSDALVSLYLLAWSETPLAPLVGLLNDPDADVRNNDALALASVLRSRGRAGLEPTEEVRSASGRLVLLVSNPEEDEFVRAHAAAALGAIGDPAATDVLVNVLTDTSSPVRTRAAEGLGFLGRSEAIPALLESLAANRAPAETRVICAAMELIAKKNGWPCDTAALGTDPTNWRAWYMAVSR